MSAAREAHAHEVIRALRTFRDRIGAIMDRVADRPRLSPDEVADLQALLTELKQDLKAAAKRGTVSETSEGPTDIESAFFSRTVYQAYANLRTRINSHPVRANWYSDLATVHMDFTHTLSQIEPQYPGA